jgi:hypothetical protein
MPVTVAASPMHVYEVRPRKHHRGVDLQRDPCTLYGARRSVIEYLTR